LLGLVGGWPFMERRGSLAQVLVITGSIVLLIVTVRMTDKE